MALARSSRVVGQHRAHHFGGAQVILVARSRRYVELELTDSFLAGVQHRQVVEILFLHLLGEFEVEKGIAELRLAQNLREALRGQPDRRMHRGIDVADAGHGRRSLLLA
jgi:hypothetical protein